MSFTCEVGVRKNVDRATVLRHIPPNPYTIPQPDRRTTEQILWGLLTPVARPCQAEESPAVSACPSWEGGGGAYTRGRVRVRNELWERVDRGGRERDKKKTVSEEGIMEINSRNGTPYGRQGHHGSISPAGLS